MRLLLVGSQAHWAIEHHYIPVLEKGVAALEIFPAPDLFAQYYQGLSHKVIFRLGLSTIYAQINAQLLSKVETFQPDIIWVWKGMELFPKTLKTLKERGVKLVNYNPDHPFIISGKGSGNTNVTKSVSLYHLHFCYNQSLAREITKGYGIATADLPFGYHYSKEALNTAESAQEIQKVAFIGNPDRIRVKMLRTLSEADIPVDVFGHHWSRYLQNSARLHIFGPVYGNDFWNAMRQYRVQLNVFRPHNIGSHNMRSFEIPAIGGIMLAPDSTEHRQFFTPEQEILLYNSPEEAVQKAKHLLSLPPQETAKIRHQAHLRSIQEGYSYQDRAIQALHTLNQL